MKNVKKNEELSQLKEKFGDNESESETESDSEVEDENGVLTEDYFYDFMKLIPVIANPEKEVKENDPLFKEIKESSDPFFKEVEYSLTDEEEEEKPVYIKDMMRNDILDKMNNEDENGKGIEGGSNKEDKKNVDFEDLPLEKKREVAKEEFLKASQMNDDNEEDFIVKKQKNENDKKEEEIEFKNFLENQPDIFKKLLVK